jgi:ABC-type dipeptide/oligopeptide/nickel transport system permease subunit
MVIVALIALALMAPIISGALGFTPSRQDLAHRFAPPFTAGHVLGTDQFGRDTLVRLLYGAQVSLSVAGLTVSMALTLGTIVGLTAGYFGGRVDVFLMRLIDVLLAIPALFFFIILAMLFKPDTVSLAVILASLGWPNVARLVRGQVLSVMNLDYILSARAVGARDRRIMLLHVLPAAIPVMVVSASISVGGVILAEASLGFLSLGIQPPAPTWGNMIAAAQTVMYQSLYALVFPGLAIFITVLSVNIFGNAARDALDPRLT